MRVLVVHNRYSSRVPSGENLAVDDEVRWLREAGVHVSLHEVTNDDIVAPGVAARVRDGLDAPWSRRAATRFRRRLDDDPPDVVHVHNLFPLLTASVPAAATQRGIPVVWTAHNFRLRCVAGTHFRDGRPCHDCRPGYRLPGVLHRCYADSATGSALVGAATSIFRSWSRRRGITAVGISRFQASWLVDAAGLDPAAVCVKYNGVSPPTEPISPPDQQRGLLYVGRVSAEKGVAHLLDAWQRTTTDTELRVVGEGPLADDVRAASRGDPRLVPLGQVPAERVSDLMQNTRAVVVPSLWEEPFGRVAVEALAHGRPVITTGTGGLREIVDDTTGWTTGLDPDEMAAALTEAAASDEAIALRGGAAVRRHAELFSPQATTEELLRVYGKAVARS
jgi:glycosyltransferase involved in cell wall biosynthesis